MLLQKSQVSQFNQVSPNLTILRRGGGCSKVGAQITNGTQKSWCAKSAIYLIEARKVGAQMRTPAH